LSEGGYGWRETAVNGKAEHPGELNAERVISAEGEGQLATLDGIFEGAKFARGEEQGAPVRNRQDEGAIRGVAQAIEHVGQGVIDIDDERVGRCG